MKYPPVLFAVVACSLSACGGDVPRNSGGDGGEDAPREMTGRSEAGRSDTGGSETGLRDAEPRDTRPSDARTLEAETDGMDSEVAAVPAAMVRVPLTGCAEFAYIAEVSIGGSQTFALQLDTGSTTLGVAASSCTSCDVSPLYAPGAQAVDEDEPASSEFGNGSDDTGWSGEIYEDAVSAGGTAAASTPMRMVAIESQSDFFYTSAVCGTTALPYQGILGLAPLANAIAGTDAYIDTLVAARSWPDIFATLLCDSGGSLWLGGYDRAYVTAPPQFTPYSTTANSADYYVVDIEDIVVAGTKVQVAAAPYTDTLLDTGNNTSFPTPAAFTTVTNAIMSSPGFVAAFGAAYGVEAGTSAFFSATGNCTDTTLTKAELDATLAPLTLVFGASPSVSVTAVATEAYLVPEPVAGRPGRWCPGVYPNAPSDGFPFAADLGSPTLRSNVVIFDREHRRIGFAPHTACP